MKLLPTRQWIRDNNANDIAVWQEHVRLQHPGLTHGDGWDVLDKHHADHQISEVSHIHRSRRWA